MITSLAENEIFVFGSNASGRHGKGAALQAWKFFGARYGTAEGLMGRSYAFPTLNTRFQKVLDEELEASRDRLYNTCRIHPDKRFLLTKVGCGLAGFTEMKMRDLFTDPPENLILPEDWTHASR